MPPQSSPPPQNNASYDFFLKAEKPKRSLGGPRTTTGRIAVVAGGVILLIIVASIISSALSGGSKTPGVLKVAQDQTEIVRISTAASTAATSTATKQFAVTAQLSMASARSDLLTKLKSLGLTYGVKQLGMTASATTDQQLAAAAAASLYDQTYTTIMKSQLTSYSSDLKSAYAGTTSLSLRQLLNSDYKQAQLLLAAVAAPPTSQ